MSEILITDLTNKTNIAEGTGIYDLLMTSIDLQLTDQWDLGRMTGAEYASVYSSALQAVLSESSKFLLNKEIADKQADLLIAQTEEVNEKIDSVIAQTAQYYESIKASQDQTIRENLLNNATISKLTEEIALLTSKNLEQVAETARKDEEHEVKITDANYGIAIKVQQEYALREKNGFIETTYAYYADSDPGHVTLLYTTDITNVEGAIVSTTTTDGVGTSTTALDKLILAAKDKLINAQTLGFASDTKQKLLKQMQDGFAVALSIAGLGNIPEANQDAAIDDLTNEILADVGSSVVVTAAEPTVLPPS